MSKVPVPEMARICSVPQCKGGSNAGFAFPKDPKLRKKWQVAIRRAGPGKKLNWEPTKSSIVCHDHFTENDYKVPKASLAAVGGKSRRALKEGAVPTVFFWHKNRDEAKVRRRPVSSSPALVGYWAQGNILAITKSSDSVSSYN